MTTPPFLCPCCHTSDDRPTVWETLDDGTRVQVHERCQREVEEAKQEINDRRKAG